MFVHFKGIHRGYIHLKGNRELNQRHFFFSFTAISTRMELDLVSTSMSEFESKERVHFGEKVYTAFNRSINDIMREIICVVSCPINH